MGQSSTDRPCGPHLWLKNQEISERHQVLAALSQRTLAGPLLSLCTGYVTHALLTRPPLNNQNIATLIVPYDLHALATPPAFVLSQDQTLHFLSSALPEGSVAYEN